MECNLLDADSSNPVVKKQQDLVEVQSEDEVSEQHKDRKQQLRDIFQQSVNIVKVMFKWSTIRVIFAHHPYCDPFKE